MLIFRCVKEDDMAKADSHSKDKADAIWTLTNLSLLR